MLSALEIRAVQSPQSIVWCAVDCTVAFNANMQTASLIKNTFLHDSIEDTIIQLSYQMWSGEVRPLNRFTLT
jgi:hypothetical protein